MKVLILLITILILNSCDSPKEVMMTYRNYSLQANRLMPLQYCNDKKSIRIWISKSTSLDRIITISKSVDSTYSCELTILGPKIDNNRNAKGYYNTKKLEPISGYVNFFKQVDSIGLNSFHDQKELEVVYDYPVKIYIIEYLNNGNYSRFRFQPGLEGSNYKAIEQLIEKEFRISAKSN